MRVVAVCRIILSPNSFFYLQFRSLFIILPKNCGSSLKFAMGYSAIDTELVFQVISYQITEIPRMTDTVHFVGLYHCVSS